MKGRFLIKGKRLNKLADAFNNIVIEDATVSEEDEAADSKESSQKDKSKVSRAELLQEKLPFLQRQWFYSAPS